MRKDGYKLKGTDAMYQVAAHIMDKRSDSMNMITIDIPLKPMEDYRHQLRREGRWVSHMALLMAAYVRTAAEFPELNRFVVNKRFYARKEFAVGMVVLKAGDAHHGIMSKIYLEMDDTLSEVNDKINAYIEKNRQVDSNNSTEQLIHTLLSIPGVLRFGVCFFKWLDKHGLLPKSVIDASPFHISLAISNLASIKTNHIYHHCYDFGTTSVFVTIGNFREVPKTVDGQVVLEKCMPLGVVMDERICSGSYFASAFRRFRSYLENPALLEVKPAQVVPDPNL